MIKELKLLVFVLFCHELNWIELMVNDFSEDINFENPQISLLSLPDHLQTTFILLVILPNNNQPVPLLSISFHSSFSLISSHLWQCSIQRETYRWKEMTVCCCFSFDRIASSLSCFWGSGSLTHSPLGRERERERDVLLIRVPLPYLSLSLCLFVCPPSDS